MSGTYEDQIKALRREVRLGGARPAEIDSLVSKIIAVRDDRSAGDLLATLSDRASDDEGMFSIIHAAEACDDSIYIESLLRNFCELSATSPRWASIVLMRVLNSEQTRLEMVRQLRTAPVKVKACVRDMCSRINEVSPEFLSKTVSTMIAAA